MNLHAASKSSPLGRILPAAVSTLPLAILACMANPALADPITLSSPTCTASNTGGAGTCSATVSNGAVSSLGVTLTSPFTSVPFGSVSLIYLYAAANASGQLSTAQTFTLAYDFTVNRISLGGDSLTYSLGFAVSDSSCPDKGTCSSSVVGVIPTGTGNYQVTGSSILALPAGTITSESLGLDLRDSNSTKSSYSITSASFLVTNGTVATAATPEPTSLLLAGTGTVLAALKRRRRKSA